MEEDRLFDERVAIRESARPLKKYGSTCNHMKRNEEHIKHVMARGDTLQGIALKYGVTVSLKIAISAIISLTLTVSESILGWLYSSLVADGENQESE